MAHTYTNLLVHCVFSTKNRERTIRDELRPSLWAYMGGIARTNHLKALTIGGTDDHVHALLSLPPTIDVAKAVQLIKGGSSKWMHDQGFTDVHWQSNYGAFTIGASQVQDTIHYIDHQAEHHQMISFEDEFRAFLKRNGMTWEEEYVFG